jgi:hypothetical protein
MRAPAAVMWPVLAWNSNQLADVSRRLALSRLQKQAVQAVEGVRAAARWIEMRMRVSEIAELIDPWPLPTAYALSAMTGDKRVGDYVSLQRKVRPVLRGDDLIAAGVPRGPDVALVLEVLRAAKLDGEVMTGEDELRLVEQFLARERIGLV